MKTAAKVGIAIFSLIGGYFAYSGIRHIEGKRRAFHYAKGLAGEKGIINLGAGPHRTLLAQEIAESPEVVVNLDIALDGMPHYIQWDIEQRLPYADKAFNVSFMSHVLEHLSNWEFALGEACRVADYAVIVLPDPFSVVSRLNTEHKQHFSKENMRAMEEKFPNVKVFS